ncbi:GspH/FimT family pseudopilin [Cognatilysobacter lacus]|nr:GspH/FimT family pseudopilin [Lysobacter lacus]
MFRRNRGFSLLELIVTMAVIAIIVGIAVPSFNSMIARSRISAGANQLVAGIQTARLLALRSNARVDLCPSTDGSTCSGSDWRHFAIIMRKGGTPTPQRDVQINGTGIVAVGSPLVSASNKIWFLADGFARTGTSTAPGKGTVSICTTRLSSENARDVQINASRVSVERPTRAGCGSPGEPLDTTL